VLFLPIFSFQIQNDSLLSDENNVQNPNTIIQVNTVRNYKFGSQSQVVPMSQQQAASVGYG
jgi:hypothetical protein